MEVKALTNTLADRIAEVKARTVRDTLRHLENYSLVKKFPALLAEMKAKTTDCTLRDVQAEAGGHDSLHATRGKSVNFVDILSYGIRGVDLEAEVLLDVLAYTLAETKPMKIDDTLADVEGITYTIP